MKTIYDFDRLDRYKTLVRHIVRIAIEDANMKSKELVDTPVDIVSTGFFGGAKTVGGSIRGCKEVITYHIDDKKLLNNIEAMITSIVACKTIEDAENLASGVEKEGVKDYLKNIVYNLAKKEFEAKVEELRAKQTQENK